MANLDADAPAFKRAKRTHSESSSNAKPAGFHRHQDLYFEDGNIVLLAENTYFKVHKGILARQSKIFQDMFSIPQAPASTTERYDSCVVVRLSDSQEDLTHVLLAMYDGVKRLRPIPFSKASAYLQLGDKYDIPSLTDEAYRYFNEAFPTSLAGLDAIFESYRRILDSAVDEHELGPDDLPDFPILLQWRDLFSAIRLHRGFLAKDAEKIPFYLCSQLLSDSLVDGLMEGSLSRSEYDRLIIGRMTLLEHGFRNINNAVKPFSSCGSCKSKADNAFDPICRDPLIPFKRLEYLWEMKRMGICHNCVLRAENIYGAKREDTFSLLNEIFQVDFTYST